MNTKNLLNTFSPERFGRWVLRWRWPIIVATLALVAAAGTGLGRIEMKNDYRVFFGKDNPQLVAYEAIRNTYTKDNNVIFVLTQDKDLVFSKNYLQAVSWLTDQAWKLPFATRVDSITNFQHSQAIEDDLLVGDLVPDPANVTPQELDQAKVIAYREPLLNNRLIGANEKVTGISVTLTLPEKENTEAMKVAAASRELAAEFEQKYPGFDVRLTGIVMLNNAFGESSIQDMSSIMPLMYLGIFTVMALRHFHCHGPPLALGGGHLRGCYDDLLLRHHRHGPDGLAGHPAVPHSLHRANHDHDPGGGRQHPSAGHIFQGDGPRAYP